MVRHGVMLSTKWMHARSWYGALPSYHLPNHDEAELEKRISKLYFDSYRFADLRMQIRLKLKESPLNSQSPQTGNPSVYWEMLELFDEYLPLFLSIQRYHSTRHFDFTALPYPLTIFPTLFYEFCGMNLLTDRLVGMQHLAQFCIPVELVLVLTVMGHLHSLHAESQISQGGETLTVTSWPRMQQAEISWQNAESFYRWAASFSIQVKEGFDSTDSLTKTICRFFEAMAIHTATLSRLCAVHRLSTHMSGLALTEMKPERLSRIWSVCARRALTILGGAIFLQPDQTEDRFSQELKWCLNAYNIRWTAIYYQCELTIYRLDANPGIAINFCEALLKLRIPHLAPASPQQQDSGFAQFSHEIHLKHHTHLTEAIDHKKSLLNECRGRYGTTWAFQALDKYLGAELLAIREMGPVFSDEQRVEEEEGNYVSPFLIEVIAANVEEAILHAKVNDPEDEAPDKSEIVVTEIPRKRGTEPTECHIVIANGGNTVDDHSKSQGSHLPNNRDHEARSPSKESTSQQLKQRPASAKQPSSGWVTMNRGGKLLHFEKSSDPPPDMNLRNVVSGMNGQPDTNMCSTIRRSRPRPSSSPCYLSSKRMTKAQATIQVDTPKTWALTRAPCALCERRFMRSSLPGVVVMKRVYELRRKWGVIQDSKKFNAPSALYGTANVCLMCQEILVYEERKPPPNPIDDNTGGSSNFDKDADIGRMIHDSIMFQWRQQPPARSIDTSLEDIATNKRVRQSSTIYSMKAQNALLSDTNRTAHTKEEFQPWWEIDLGNYVEVHSVKVDLCDEVNHLYAAAKGLTANPRTRAFPLHISISMKTGLERDFDEIIAGAASSLCATDKMGLLIELVAPQNCRGRYVRVQCEGHAVLHIERVHVYVAKPPPKVVHDPVARRQHFRQKLQRAAFCASAIATAATPVIRSSRVAVETEADPQRRLSANRTSRRTPSESEQLAAALFFDPERAEKKRISRLYARFKSLLDARAKYAAPEEDSGEEANKEEEEGKKTTQKMKGSA